ncbi:hypothetical protein, partial [Bosea sp. (in: a-proteobacteria)]|uniref:hypothetical protein n=1 Tax=Bosea sp. (in: a-proteobacteria) TaxID=1871050 RepID=UPI004034EF10
EKNITQTERQHPLRCTLYTALVGKWRIDEENFNYFNNFMQRTSAYAAISGTSQPYNNGTTAAAERNWSTLGLTYENNHCHPPTATHAQHCLQMHVQCQQPLFRG